MPARKHGERDVLDAPRLLVCAGEGGGATRNPTPISERREELETADSLRQPQKTPEAGYLSYRVLVL